MSLSSLNHADVDAAIAGGLLLSAGGSGRARVAQNQRFAERALARGALPVCRIGDLPPQGQVLVSTAVGAPGAGKHLADPDHAVRAAHLLVESCKEPIAAVMPGHVPGIYAWLLAAELGVPLLDAACNGRGHPTVRMGALGLSSQPDVKIYQTGVGAHLEVVLHGNLLTTSTILRASAVQAGGLIMACRGPLPAELVAAAGAPGAISHQMLLGAALLEAGDDANQRLAALERVAGAKVLARGEVVSNTVAYSEGFDVGSIGVSGGLSGEPVTLGVCNEFMTVESQGRRVSTFPDLQAAIDLDTGAVLAISEMVVGMRAAVIVIPKQRLAMGSGILDRVIYEDVEQRMGVRLADYALDPAA